MLVEHPRYGELCATHGAPNIVRKSDQTDVTKGEPKPGSVAARLVRFVFYIPAGKGQEPREITKALPRTIGVYALKGLIGRIFGLKAMKLKLVWENGEWDPVAGANSSDDMSDEETDSEAEGGEGARGDGDGFRDGRDLGNWVQREQELVDGTKDVGFWIEGREARVRIDMR